MREHWANLQNQALERAGSIDRVDHRSLEAQRVEAEQERDRLQERITELESVIDGYAMQLVEPDNLDRMDTMLWQDINKEWDTAQRAEWDRKTTEQQLQFATIRAAELDRAPQVKLGPSASAMERKAMHRAHEQGIQYEPATERGESVQEAQEQLSFADEARERFDAARTAYSEARELGLKAERLEREKHQKQEQERDVPSPREREPEREASVWDALDSIGREPPSPQDQKTTSDAMQRIQDRTTEQRDEREREAAKVERAKLEREKMEQDRDQGLGRGYGL